MVGVLPREVYQRSGAATAVDVALRSGAALSCGMRHGAGETVGLGAATPIKWLLFCLMVTTVPVLYFMFVIGGYLPLVAIAAMSFRGMWGFVFFNVVHLLAYGSLFYWIAKVISRRLALLSQTWRLVGFGGTSAALLAVSFLPIYGVGHHQYHAVNLYRLLTRLFTDGL
jgi:hypothetical protein